MSSFYNYPTPDLPTTPPEPRAPGRDWIVAALYGPAVYCAECGTVDGHADGCPADDNDEPED